MKPSANTLDSLADIERLETSGQLRRVGAQMLLALARKEISATDVDSASKMIDAQARSLEAEVKTMKACIELRERGADIGKAVHLGQLLLGGAAPTASEAS